jgi:hypothetical protein
VSDKLVVEGELIDMRGYEVGDSGLKVDTEWLSWLIEQRFGETRLPKNKMGYSDGVTFGKVRITIERLTESE